MKLLKLIFFSFNINLNNGKTICMYLPIREKLKNKEIEDLI